MMQMSKVVKRSMLKSNKFIAPFRMTNDNPSFEPPKATNVKIHGDLKENNKITITADVNGGVEVISVVQWYKTTTIELDIQNGLEEISMCTTEKEFLLPIGVSGYYIVAKYTPMTFDGKSGEPVFVTSENVVESEIYTQKRKVRGKNHNKKVASLKTGEKLPIVFYNNRAVEENHQSWSRHLGRIVRNPNICPIRVKSWKEIGKKEKDHMWESVKDKFENPDMELYRDYTLEHMNTLWVNWRSCLNAKYVKPCKTVAEALKNKPEGMEKEDWEWLTKHFFTKDFQKISSQASQNRAKSSMPHRTGSKPHRQIIYEMGGKEGNPPDMGILFFETRKKDGKLVEPETEEKHLQIVKTIQAEPTLSTIEVIEKCFGAQHHSNVFGYGGGIKRKNFKDPRQKKMDELQAKLHNKDEENRILKRHIAKIEERLLRIEHFMQQNPNVSTEFPLSELDQELHKNDV